MAAVMTLVFGNKVLCDNRSAHPEFFYFLGDQRMTAHGEYHGLFL